MKSDKKRKNIDITFII